MFFSWAVFIAQVFFRRRGIALYNACGVVPARPSFQWKHMHERNFIGPYFKRSQSSKSRKVRRYGFILVSYLTALSPVHSYERWKECWRISFPFGHNHRLNKYLQVGAKATVAHRNMSTCLFKIPDLLRQEIRRNFRNLNQPV